MEFDANVVINGLVGSITGGGVVWAVLRNDVKWIIKDVDRIRNELKDMWKHIHG